MRDQEPGTHCDSGYSRARMALGDPLILKAYMDEVIQNFILNP